MKVENLNTYPIALFDASFMRHVIPARSQYELPDGTDVSYFVGRGVMKVIEETVASSGSDDSDTAPAEVDSAQADNADDAGEEKTKTNSTNKKGA